jgi:hypothetical protein
MDLALAVVLGAFWGVLWALCLCTPLGRFLAQRHTWLVVVIGVGVDLLILLIVLPLETWLPVVCVVAASSIGIIIRSLWNEWNDHVALIEDLNGHQDPHRQ